MRERERERVSLSLAVSFSLSLSRSPAAFVHSLTMHRLAHTRPHPHPTSLQHSCNVQACRASCGSPSQESRGHAKGAFTSLPPLPPHTQKQTPPARTCTNTSAHIRICVWRAGDTRREHHHPPTHSDTKARTRARTHTHTPREHHHPPTHTHTDTKARTRAHTHTHTPTRPRSPRVH